MLPLNYLASLKTGKMILWCYLIWYLNTVFFYFDPSPRIWINSLGLSLVIGIALLLSVSQSTPKSNKWQTFRLFAMPFCVSSFSSLIKGQGYILILPPTLLQQGISTGLCLVFLLIVYALKHFWSPRTVSDG